MANVYFRKQPFCSDEYRAMTEGKSMNKALLMNTLAIEIAGVKIYAFNS
jgi:hypothetical protein